VNKNENILAHLHSLIGPNVKVEESPKSEAEREEAIFIETISTLEQVWIGDHKLHEEHGIDLLGYSQYYYHIMENLIVLKYGYDKADIIWWWVLDRFSENGELLGIEMDGKVYEIKTAKQLYSFLKKL
jgi:hypothetical protein